MGILSSNITFYISKDFFRDAVAVEKKGFVCLPAGTDLGWPVEDDHGNNMINATAIIKNNSKPLGPNGKKWMQAGWHSGPNPGGDYAQGGQPCAGPNTKMNIATDSSWQCGYGTCYLKNPDDSDDLLYNEEGQLIWEYGKEYVLCKDIITEYCRKHPQCVGFSLTTMDGGGGEGTRVWMYTHTNITNRKMKKFWIKLDKEPSANTCNQYKYPENIMPELCQPWCGIPSNKAKNISCAKDCDSKQSCPCPYNPQPNCGNPSDQGHKYRYRSPYPSYHPCIAEDQENPWTTDNINNYIKGYMSNAGAYLVWFPEKFFPSPIPSPTPGGSGEQWVHSPKNCYNGHGGACINISGELCEGENCDNCNFPVHNDLSCQNSCQNLDLSCQAY